MPTSMQKVRVRQFGAKGDGVTNDSPAIQAAFDFAATFTTAVVELDAGVRYKCATGLSLQTDRVRFDGNGATLDFSSMTNGVAFSPVNTQADLTARLSLNQAHPIENVVFNGAHSGTATGVLIEDSISNQICGVTFRGCSFIGFKTAIVFSNGAFLTVFDNCFIGLLASFVGAVGVSLPSAAANAGERNTFINCWFGGATMTGLELNNGNASTFLTNCSLDYCKRFITITTGNCFLTGCHVENNLDTDYWFHVTGDVSGMLAFYNTQLVSPAAKSSYTIFYCDPTSLGGGVVYDGGHIAFGASPGQALVTGAGRTVFRNVAWYYGGAIYPIGPGQNLLAYPSFEGTGGATDWTLSGATPPAVSAAEARTGTKSLSFPGTVGVIAEAKVVVPCLPGQYLAGSLWYKATGITGTGATLFVGFNYLDAAGVSITGATHLGRTTDQSTWTFVNASVGLPAPAGTRQVQFIISIFGTTSGTPVGYIDDVTLNLI